MLIYNKAGIINNTRPLRSGICLIGMDARENAPPSLLLPSSGCENDGGDHHLSTSLTAFVGGLT
jgi:hypothetical protein